MDITLNKPQFRQFVEDEIKSGRFASPADVVEAALARLMDDRELTSLDDETIAALAEADAEIERGNGIDFDKFAADARARFGAGQGGR
ncbi:MAG TPA: type II toxin-antitoxin system ParD family antitoxin [Gemmataceae bacterium]|jgi:Arc/MetJ-type ribon-helix-helix transcriptional regulator|nr:type II toxin-antitoxin system ParD family antitoxin [Gemmataceae bacterium]